MNKEGSKPAAFSLESYHFRKFSLESDLTRAEQYDLNFSPSSKFYIVDETSFCDVLLKFKASELNEGDKKLVVDVEMLARFKFNGSISFNDIPDYFYKNSIAIIFPYLRAFVSTMTLQANIPLVLLPTLNLANLAKPLEENTVNEAEVKD